jgi:phospholipid/cholesterol/gamma-HCH transport system ATP-binding protein
MVLMHGGLVLAEGTPEQIRTTSDPVVQQFIQGKAEGPIPLRLSSRDFAEDLLGG